MKPSPTSLTSESLLHLVCEPCTWILFYILFCSLIVSCTYSSSLNCILTFVSQERVFFLCVFCRNRRVSTEARLGEHLPDALFSWAHVERRNGGEWGFQVGKKETRFGSRGWWWSHRTTESVTTAYFPQTPVPVYSTHWRLRPHINPSVLKLACRTTALSCVQGRDLIYPLSSNSTQPWGFETAPGGKLPNLNWQGLLLPS